MRKVLVSFVLLSAMACGQPTTTTSSSSEGSADVASGQEAAPAAGEQDQAAGSEAEKLEDEQTEE